MTALCGQLGACVGGPRYLMRHSVGKAREWVGAVLGSYPFLFGRKSFPLIEPVLQVHTQETLRSCNLKPG
jgi:hypothetical protein